MCFSAQASFTASVALSTMGAVTLKKHHSKNKILFALIPLFFGMQQLAEGLVWMKLSLEAIVVGMATSAYLFFALLFWPVWVSLSLMPMETKKPRRILIILCLIVGVSISFYIAYWIYHGDPFIAVLRNNHVAYRGYYPYEEIILYLYLACVLIPLMVTSVKHVWMLGLLLGAAFLYSDSSFVASENALSLWCFFAGLSSLVVYRILSKQPSEL